jgi:hypothetical protein
MNIFRIKYLEIWRKMMMKGKMKMKKKMERKGIDYERKGIN